MGRPYTKRRTSEKWVPDTAAAKNYADADSLVTDLGTGQLDLAGAERRIRGLYDAAIQAGVMVGVEASAEQIQKLAAENRTLRIRLVQKSLTDSQGVA
jgi:hypothetical protein